MKAQTVEPSVSLRQVVASGAGFTLLQRIESAPIGRAVLGWTRWLVVFGLVASGYLGAAAIHSGVQHARPAQGSQHILAAVPARN